MCNCEYCVPCICGHKADEHMCGEGPCFLCECGGFENPAVTAWDMLSTEDKLSSNFEDFVDNYNTTAAAQR